MKDIMPEATPIVEVQVEQLPDNKLSIKFIALAEYQGPEIQLEESLALKLLEELQKWAVREQPQSVQDELINEMIAFLNRNRESEEDDDQIYDAGEL